MTPDRLKSEEEKEKEYAFLALAREEIPIILRNEWPDYYPDFVVPIHPLLSELPEEIRFDQKYAEEVFGQVWGWTCEDIEQFINDPDKNVNEKERKYLKRMIGEGKEYWQFKGFGRSQDFLLSAQCRGEGTFVYPSRELIPLRAPISG